MFALTVCTVLAAIFYGDAMKDAIWQIDFFSVLAVSAYFIYCFWFSMKCTVKAQKPGIWHIRAMSAGMFIFLVYLSFIATDYWTNGLVEGWAGTIGKIIVVFAVLGFIKSLGVLIFMNELIEDSEAAYKKLGRMEIIIALAIAAIALGALKLFTAYPYYASLIVAYQISAIALGFIPEKRAWDG